MKKIGKIIGMILVLLIIAAVLWVKFIPLGQLNFLKNSDNPIAKLICAYPVKISGESMQPFLMNGTTIIFDKCFEAEELKNGVILVYADGAIQRIGIIRSLQNLGRVVYKVSNESRAQEINDVLLESIIGISYSDTSGSTYEEDQSSQIIINEQDYFSEIYLGSIPKNQGLETSTIKKSISFDLNQDKFCFIVNPVKELRNMDIEIIKTSANTNEFNIKDIIYSPGENINCDNDQIRLDSGDYIFKVFVENILIKEIAFVVQ